MSDWTGAELRARLYSLGLTVRDFAAETGRDRRTVERAVTGKSERVTHAMAEQVVALEEKAAAQLAEWDAATEEGAPIEIPRLNQEPRTGTLPARWYLALAARHVDKWGADAQIEWSGE